MWQFSADEVLQEYQDKSPISFLFGISFILRRFIDDTDKFQKAKEESDSGKVVKLLDGCHAKIWETFELYFEMIEEYVKYDTLNVMKSNLK